jgi:hypothetical protein
VKPTSHEDAGEFSWRMKRRSMTRPGRLIGAAVVVALAVPLATPPAGADERSRDDPRDAGPRLDIRRVSHGHVGEDEFLHDITMYRRFPSRMFRPGGRGRLEVFLYEKKNQEDGTLVQMVSRVKLVWRDGRLRGPIFDELHEGLFPERIGTARVSRPDRRTVRVVVPRDVLGDLENPPVYIWVVRSRFRDGNRCNPPCWDVAPGWGGVHHRVG